MGAGKRPVDYGMAEALAFASLVKTGTHVRMSGQDSRRGTFNQRHSGLIDIENENEYVPLENIAPGQARCEIYNSLSPKRECWVSSTDTAAIIPNHLCSGKP